jgi:flagellar hook-length control protein FliK
VLASPDPSGRQVTARLRAHDAGDGQRLTIELDPAELGPVDVSLRLDDQGNAAAVFGAERAETLQLLQRDARTLIDLLTAAGFSLDQGKLAFVLRDGSRDSGQPQQPFAGAGPSSTRRRSAEGGTIADAATTGRRGLLDLRV